MKPARRFPDLPAGENPFEWILLTAANLRGEQRTARAILKAKREAQRPPREVDPKRVARRKPEPILEHAPSCSEEPGNTGNSGNSA